MGDVYYKTLILVITIALGYFLKRIGIFVQSDAQTISKIMMKITLPCVVVKNLNGMELNTDILLAALIGIGANGFFFLCAFLFGRKDSPEDRLVKIFSLSSFNIGNYAIPVLSSFVGPGAMACVLAFNYPGTALFTYGVAPTAASLAFSHSGDRTEIQRLRASLLHNIPMIACAVMMLFSVFHVVLPEGVVGIFSSISSANNTLAMLSIGILLEFGFVKGEALQCAGILGTRLMAAILSAAVIYFWVPIPAEFKYALMVAVFAPVSSVNPMLAVHCGYMGSKVALVNSAYLLISIICMTLLIMLLY